VGATLGFELRKPRSLLSAAVVRAASSLSICASSNLTEASAEAVNIGRVNLASGDNPLDEGHTALIHLLEHALCLLDVACSQRNGPAWVSRLEHMSK
jgi:hypothetical protein